MTRIAAILFITLPCWAQILPPLADTGWMAADTTVSAQVQPVRSVTLMWECYDYDYEPIQPHYYTGLDVSTNLVDWVCVAGFPAKATNVVSVPRTDMMFFRRWMCETNKF
jgi:hypothetical protein